MVLEAAKKLRRRILSVRGADEVDPFRVMMAAKQVPKDGFAHIVLGTRAIHESNPFRADPQPKFIPPSQEHWSTLFVCLPIPQGNGEPDKFGPRVPMFFQPVGVNKLQGVIRRLGTEGSEESLILTGPT